MFELLADSGTLPVPEDAIIQIHSGMNKLRVSVGNYVSEPSEVYIITSEDETLLRSFIVFFVVEPGTHVIYGYESNPYDPALREEVLQEAVDFVEEMGAILEEVPWGNMSPEERHDWIINESIYHFDDVEEAEEIVDMEEIEPEELQEILEEEIIEDVTGPVEEEDTQAEPLEQDMLEVEVDEAEESTGETPPEVEEEDIKATEPDQEPEDDGDFDSLLKQAFLKPDLVKKTKMKNVTDEEEPIDEELSPDEGLDDEKAVATGEEPGEADEDDLAVNEDSLSSGLETIENGEQDLVMPDEGLEVDGDDDLTALIQEISEEHYSEEVSDASRETEKSGDEGSGDQSRTTVIRYLSRF